MAFPTSLYSGDICRKPRVSQREYTSGSRGSRSTPRHTDSLHAARDLIACRSITTRTRLGTDRAHRHYLGRVHSSQASVAFSSSLYYYTVGAVAPSAHQQVVLNGPFSTTTYSQVVWMLTRVRSPRLLMWKLRSARMIAECATDTNEAG